MNLPEGYEILNYIEATGTQWIILNYNPTNLSGFRAEYYQPSPSLTETYILGASESPGIARDILMLPIHRIDRVDKVTETIRFAFGKIWQEYPYPFGNKTFVSSINFLNSRTAEVDGDIVGKCETANFTTCNNIVLFSFYLEYALAYYPFYGKLYDLKISEGTEIVRHYVPALDDKKRPCLYELIERKTYYNGAVGSNFLYG